jgi:hypothetical protein
VAHTYAALHKLHNVTPRSFPHNRTSEGCAIQRIGDSLARVSPAFSYYGAEFLGLVSDNKIVSERSRIVELATKLGFLRCKARILDFVASNDRS